MKFNVVYSLSFLLLLVYVIMGNEAGRADSQGQGNTGAPGDEIFNNTPRTCQTCHNSAAILVATSIDVLDDQGTPVLMYSPGETYRVRVSVNVVVGNPAGYGFQIVALAAPTGVNANDIPTWSNPASNVKIAEADNGRTYAEHNGQSASNVFEVDWAAPEAGTGPITFYSCGNAVNDNDLNSGDGAGCFSLMLMEGTVPTRDLANISTQIHAYPNPVRDILHLNLDVQNTGTYLLDILDMSGKKVFTKSLDLLKNSNSLSLETELLGKGTYILQLSSEDAIVTKTVLKI